MNIRSVALAMGLALAGMGQAEVRFQYALQVSNPFCVLYPDGPEVQTFCKLFPPQFGVLILGVSRDVAAARVRWKVRWSRTESGAAVGEEAVAEVVEDKLPSTGPVVCRVDAEPCNAAAWVWLAGDARWRVVSIEAIEEPAGKVVMGPLAGAVY